MIAFVFSLFVVTFLVWGATWPVESILRRLSDDPVRGYWITLGISTLLVAIGMSFLFRDYVGAVMVLSIVGAGLTVIFTWRNYQKRVIARDQAPNRVFD